MEIKSKHLGLKLKFSKNYRSKESPQEWYGLGWEVLVFSNVPGFLVPQLFCGLKIRRKCNMYKYDKIINVLDIN